LNYIAYGLIALIPIILIIVYKIKKKKKKAGFEIYEKMKSGSGPLIREDDFIAHMVHYAGEQRFPKDSVSNISSRLKRDLDLIRYLLCERTGKGLYVEGINEVIDKAAEQYLNSSEEPVAA
jgi:hypothetical protein